MSSHKRSFEESVEHNAVFRREGTDSGDKKKVLRVVLDFAGFVHYDPPKTADIIERTWALLVAPQFVPTHSIFAVSWKRCELAFPAIRAAADLLWPRYALASCVAACCSLVGPLFAPERSRLC
jgi:hypothetical protein